MQHERVESSSEWNPPAATATIGRLRFHSWNWSSSLFCSWFLSPREMISFPQGSKGQWNITIGTTICPSFMLGGGSVGTSVCPSRFKPKALTTPSLRKSKVCCVPAATATSADGWATHLNRILQNYGCHLRNHQGFRVETHICGEMDCSRKIFEVLLLTKITLVWGWFLIFHYGAAISSGKNDLLRYLLSIFRSRTAPLNFDICNRRKWNIGNADSWRQPFCSVPNQRKSPSKKSGYHPNSPCTLQYDSQIKHVFPHLLQDSYGTYTRYPFGASELPFFAMEHIWDPPSAQGRWFHLDHSGRWLSLDRPAAAASGTSLAPWHPGKRRLGYKVQTCVNYDPSEDTWTYKHL